MRVRRPGDQTDAQRRQDTDHVAMYTRYCHGGMPANALSVRGRTDFAGVPVTYEWYELSRRLAYRYS